MTAKDFVLSKFPKARVERYEQGAGVVKNLRKPYYLCWSDFRGERLSEGTSNANAWNNAKKNITSNNEE